MKSSAITITVVVVMMVVIGFLYVRYGSTVTISDTYSLGGVVEEFSVPILGERYLNQKYRFSFANPDGFSVREFSDDLAGVDYLVIENEKGEGVQVAIKPFDDIKVINESLIRSQIPDMKISDVQVLEIGESYRGVAFISDNPAFGGSSREVWFVFKSNLYQISTYARLDELLKTVFSTWQFE